MTRLPPVRRAPSAPDTRRTALPGAHKAQNFYWGRHLDQPENAPPSGGWVEGSKRER